MLGLILPFIPTLSFALLAIVSLTNDTASSAIAVDKLLLGMVVLSPVVYAAGAVLSLVALRRSDMKMTAAAGAIVNTALLVLLLCFRQCFLAELGLAS